MMDDTLLDAFEVLPLFELEQKEISLEFVHQDSTQCTQKFQTVQSEIDEDMDHRDFHIETLQPFDLPSFSTPDEGMKQISDDVDEAIGVVLSIEDELVEDNHKCQESNIEKNADHNEEVPLHIQDLERSTCTHDLKSLLYTCSDPLLRYSRFGFLGFTP
ncbi:unnamed protein product [Cuscuta epithymum]|uniref:Uncharacterized protein n=1 Tax=Cuscuta epithymum TaxID=186058 RepID=A0AAV0CCD4_9ASTE|nr:unnamed protein product [Cuscuta epithymum]